MVSSVRIFVLLSGIVLFPAAVFAQASITGTVKDASGAVLPGVTVEAASSVLIEKVRSVVTDGSGGYRIIDLRPGTYTLTFSLAGFNTVRREGMTLTGSLTAVVDAELRVGGIEETITVTGETPTVDVQSTTKQRVIDANLIASIPTGRTPSSLGVLITGINSTAADVGGSQGNQNTIDLSAHGSRPGDQRLLQNGLPVNDLQMAGGSRSGAAPNVGAAAEVVLDFAGQSAEQATGGVSVNLIPRDGGNSLKSSTFFGFATEELANSNLTQRLKDRGLTSVTRIERNWDLNLGVGGPVKRDRVWYYATGRYDGARNYAAGMYANKNAFNLSPDAWTYVADTSRPAYAFDFDEEDAQSRLTVQASQKHKFSVTWGNNLHCTCPNQISSTVSPEAATEYRFPHQRTLMTEWSSPLTSRLLAQAIVFHKTLRWGNMHLRVPSEGGSLEVSPAELAVYPQLVGVTEQSSGLDYHGPRSTFNNTWVPNYSYRVALSYVTGAHNFKVGWQDSFGYLKNTVYSYEVPYRYRFLNGVPNQITQFTTPWTQKSDQDHDLGVFVQDRWTIRRMTISGALRFDYFRSSYPAQTLGPAPLVPSRNWTFPSEDNLNWKDVTFRSGGVYSVGGDGKTAVKVALNKYLAGQALGGFGSSTNPIGRLVNATSRTWIDANRDFVPQCDLRNVAANGECARAANVNFGTNISGLVTDKEVRAGWGHRPNNWELSTGIQREIFPRVALDVGFFRRWYGNFAVTDDLNLTPDSFNAFSITVPADSRLPTGGKTITGLYDLKPELFGTPSNNVARLSDNYGKQLEHWNGFDISIQARLSRLQVQGGASTGRTTTDNCAILAVLPEMTVSPTSRSSTSTEFCHVETPWLTHAKALVTYTIPRINVIVAGTFQSIVGVPLQASVIVSSNVIAQSLGRPLSGSAPNATINVIPAVGLINNNPSVLLTAATPANSTLYGERVNQLDLRVGKAIRVGSGRTTLNLDIYNVTNGDTVTGTNNNYATLWRPTNILPARFVKFTMQVEF